MTRPSIDELVRVATEAGWPDEPSKVWPEDVENAVRAVVEAIDGAGPMSRAIASELERLEQEGEWE